MEAEKEMRRNLEIIRECDGQKKQKIEEARDIQLVLLWFKVWPGEQSIDLGRCSDLLLNLFIDF